MRILAPIDGSKCSFRALEFAIDFAQTNDAELEVVHITDHATESTDEVIDRARELFEDEERRGDVDVYFDVRKFRRSSRIGKNILDIAETKEIDHIVMGHHGTGMMGRAILGSAAETVIRGTEIPVTIIP